MKVLTPAEVADALAKLPRWDNDGDAITAHFTFKDFKEALEHVNRLGKIAEVLNHHPDIILHTYNQLTIISHTHKASGITQKDIELAEKIEQTFT